MPCSVCTHVLNEHAEPTKSARSAGFVGWCTKCGAKPKGTGPDWEHAYKEAESDKG